MCNHLNQQLAVWSDIDRLVQAEHNVQLDGESLTIAQLVAISRHRKGFELSKATKLAQRMRDSIGVVQKHMDGQNIVYGMNTAPGANADARPTDYRKLQSSFFQHHQCGILPETAFGATATSASPMALPDDVVIASAAIRCNSLVRGHSAIRYHVVESLADLISRGITPLIPCRGSISASGDLSPLSYFGGMLEGNKGVSVRLLRSDGTQDIVPASEVLQGLGKDPISFEAKEGLSIMNGTAVSTAFAALVLQDCQDLVILSELLTAMAVEALCGKVENFHPFIGAVRPHQGQIEVADNVRDFLTGSKLTGNESIPQTGLAQDRYSIRTASQWIGPLIEDIRTAELQLKVELNSTTDNPLIDSTNARIHHGGNFQAAAATSAMEKSRTAILNPDLSQGLPPNLCADEPALSFTCKGIDVNMTSYYSEMAFLTNSVVSHVQTAESNNQSINSLALISARMTGNLVELLSMMAAADIYLLCQAVDLRTRDQMFLEEARIVARSSFLALCSCELEQEGPGTTATFDTWWGCHCRQSGLSAQRAFPFDDERPSHSEL
uniref:Phenylalanine ammonia-lyase n=1 Tax=Bionectria ochroleuca TaxID=29856 RepID=A0A8H7TU21_BIOOC